MNCPHCNVALKLVVAKGLPFESQPNLADVGELLSAIDPTALDEKSRTFYDETKARYEQWHDRIKMSPKQMQWLQNLATGERF